MKINHEDEGLNMFLWHAISTAEKNHFFGLMGYHATCVAREHAATVFWVDVSEEVCYLHMQSASLEREQ
jgi:hypothetical protein